MKNTCHISASIENKTTKFYAKKNLNIYDRKVGKVVLPASKLVVNFFTAR